MTLAPAPFAQFPRLRTAAVRRACPDRIRPLTLLALIEQHVRVPADATRRAGAESERPVQAVACLLLKLSAHCREAMAGGDERKDGRSRQKRWWVHGILLLPERG